MFAVFLKIVAVLMNSRLLDSPWIEEASKLMLCFFVFGLFISLFILYSISDTYSFFLFFFWYYFIYFGSSPL